MGGILVHYVNFRYIYDFPRDRDNFILNWWLPGQRTFTKNCLSSQTVSPLPLKKINKQTKTVLSFNFAQWLVDIIIAFSVAAGREDNCQLCTHASLVNS